MLRLRGMPTEARHFLNKHSDVTALKFKRFSLTLTYRNLVLVKSHMVNESSAFR